MSVLLSRKLANPIYFPGLPTIWRERLLHARRLGRDVEPEIAHQNGSAFEVFLIEKLAAIAGKLASDRRQAKSPVIKRRPNRYSTDGMWGCRVGASAP